MNNDYNDSGIGNSFTNAPDKSAANPIDINTQTENGNKTNNVKQPKIKKQRHGISGAVLAVTLVFCILLSGAAGFGGAIIANSINSNDSGSSQNNSVLSADTDDSSSSVIYKSVSTAANSGTTSENAIANVAATASDSVVEIVTEVVETSTFYGQYVTSGAGSGVIITSDGYIITCDHVVEGASSIKVTTTDGTQYDATVVGEDSVTDIAVIKIDATGLISAVIGDSDKLVVGDDAIAIGNPLGELGGTVTNGIISALDRAVNIDGQSYNLLQTNAAINPGNSGGGLFNINGELIGVVNAKSSGTGIEGLGFAIPINDAITVAKQLIDNGYITGRPILGVYVKEITSSTDYWSIRSSEYASLINYITDTGIYFIKYNTDAGQTEGDFQFGDRIIAIDGVSVSAKSDLSSILNSDYKVGDTVTITVARITDLKTMRSEMVDVKVTLIENVPTASTETSETTSSEG